LNYSSSNFSSKRGFPAGNPIANALVIIVGALAIGASVVLGFFAFVILASILVIFSAFVGIRLWWFNRKLARHRPESGKSTNEKKAGVIEGEYHVVVEERIEPGDRESH
jgi:membrane protein implicated in regulation of membrane protease activity